MHTIEPLEPRIAPASLTGRVLHYTDVDGDKVTVSFTKGTLAASNFTFNNAFATTGSQQLQRIDVSGVSDIDGSDLIVKVVRGTEGDGLANIGEIIATGHDLKTVRTSGDVGKIVAGNNAMPAPGIKSLTIGSHGAYDGTTQPAGGNQSSAIAGDVTNFKILRDYTAGGFGIVGSIAKLTIGGSILGGSIDSDARLVVNGNLVKGTIGGSIVGGNGKLSGCVFVGGNLGTLLVRGSILGGSCPTDQTNAQIEVDGSANKITIGGAIRGVGGAGTQDSIYVAGLVGSLSVGGDVTAVDGKQVTIKLANTVNIPGVAVRSVTIKGSTQNLTLSASNRFDVPGPVTVDKITIGGSFIKSRIAIGAADTSDTILGTADDTLNAASRLNSLVIVGAAFGTVAGTDSYAIEAGTIVTAKITGKTYPGIPGAQSTSVSPSGDVLLRDVV